MPRVGLIAMKIACDACQAKYSISDDKVQGKLFKIRCKKCSHIIIVRGADAEPSDAVWHLVIDQEQVGPMTRADVEHRFAAGEATADTFTWREGQPDWLPLGEIEAFAALAPKPAATTAPAPVSSGVAVAADVAEVAAQKLKSERNETSVLFSLNNLADIATSTTRRVPASTPSNATPTAPGAAAGEGSGLIDIRSMASVYLGASGAAPIAGKSASSSIGSIDDLPTFGTTGFAEPAVIMPTARPAGNTKLLNLMFVAFGMLAVIAVILVVLVVSGDKSAQQDTTTATPSTPTTSTTPALTAEPPIAKPANPPQAPPPIAKPPVAVTAVTPPPAKRIPTRTAAVTPAAPTRTAPPNPQPAAGECDQVSCVVNGFEGACCAKFRTTPPPGPTATKTNLPASIDRAMITAGIDGIKARVMTCGNKSSAKGKVLAKVSVAPSGSVKNIALESTPDAALGSCVAAQLQKASFASTQTGGSFRVPFTF